MSLRDTPAETRAPRIGASTEGCVHLAFFDVATLAGILLAFAGTWMAFGLAWALIIAGAGCWITAHTGVAIGMRIFHKRGD